MSYDIQILDIPPVLPPVSEIEYQVDGGSIVPISASVGNYPVGFRNPGTYANRIRGKNTLGVGPWSTNKNKTITWADIFSYYSLGQGWVYDLSRMDTLWQDHTQTNPVTDYGQTVGYQLDLSGNNNHRSRSDVAARPIYGRHPASGPRNLLIATEDLSNASTWNRSNATVATGVVDPLGGNTAVTLTATGANGLIRQLFTGLSGTNTFSCWIRRRTGTGIVSFYRGSGTSVTVITASITSQWQRLSAAPTAAGGVSDSAGIVLNAIGDEVDIWQPQFELGSAATTYQRVGATRWDITETGSPDCFFLSYDGINDSMQTIGSVNPSTDEVTCIVGQRRERDTFACFLVEHSNNSGFNLGTFALLGNTTDGSVNYRAQSRGNLATATLVISGLQSPHRSVLSMQSKVSQPLVQGVSRPTPGTQVQSTSNQGSTNYSSQIVYFGARAGTSLYYVGREYFNFCCFKLLPSDVLSGVEAFASGKAGVA